MQVITFNSVEQVLKQLQGGEQNINCLECFSEDDYFFYSLSSTVVCRIT